MDTEQILTQSVLTVFTFVFIFFACWTKTKIEKKYKQTRENIERSKLKLQAVKSEENVLNNQLYFETRHRRHRSVLTSSLIRTMNEELGKLKHVSTSVKRIHELSALMSSIPVLDTTLATRNTLGFGDRGHRMWGVEKVTRTKVYRSWGVLKRGFKVNSISKTRSRLLRSNTDLIKEIMHDNSLQERLVRRKCVNNSLVYTVGKFCDKEEKNTLNSFIKKKNNKVREFSKSISLQNIVKRDNDSVVDIKRQSISCEDFNSRFEKIKEQKPKQKSRYSLPNSRCYRGINSNLKPDLVKESFVHVTEKCDQQELGDNYVLRMSKLSASKLRKTLKPNYGFLIDLIYNGKGFDPSQSIIRNECKKRVKGTSDEIKPLNLRTCHVHLKHGVPKRNYFSYTYKIPIKINKKKTVLKFVVNIIVKAWKGNGICINTENNSKNTKHCKRLDNFGSVVEKIEKNTNSKTVDSFDSSSRDNSRKYRNKTLCPFEGAEVAHQIDARNLKVNLCYNYEYELEDRQAQINKAILSECIGLSNKFQTKNAKSYYADLPRLIQWLKTGKRILSTITEEEPLEDVHDCLGISQEVNSVSGVSEVSLGDGEKRLVIDEILLEEIRLENTSDGVVTYSRYNGSRIFTFDNNSLSLRNYFENTHHESSANTLSRPCFFDSNRLGNTLFEGFDDSIPSECTSNVNISFTRDNRRESEAAILQEFPQNNQAILFSDHNELLKTFSSAFSYIENLCVLKNRKKENEAAGNIVVIEESEIETDFLEGANNNFVNQHSRLLMVEGTLVGSVEDIVDRTSNQRSSNLLIEKGQLSALGEHESLKETSETSFKGNKDNDEDNLNCS